MLAVKVAVIEDDNNTQSVIIFVTSSLIVTNIVHMMSGDGRKSILVTSFAMKVTADVGSVWFVTSTARLVTEEGK